MKTISICVTTLDRPDDTINSFKDVLDDERVSEVVISDDFSGKANYQKLIENVLTLKNTKVKLHTNPCNYGVYKNKMKAISLATNEYVIQFDSDNILNKEYIDAVYSQEWNPKVILAPTFARPEFDYREFSGIKFDKNTIQEYIERPMVEVLLNTMNYFINREEYLKAWEPADDVNIADSIYMAYLLLRNGCSILPVAGMEYDHTVHSGSNFQVNAKQSQQLPDEVKKKIQKI